MRKKFYFCTSLFLEQITFFSDSRLKQKAISFDIKYELKSRNVHDCWKKHVCGMNHTQLKCEQWASANKQTKSQHTGAIIVYSHANLFNYFILSTKHKLFSFSSSVHSLILITSNEIETLFSIKLYINARAHTPFCFIALLVECGKWLRWFRMSAKNEFDDVNKQTHTHALVNHRVVIVHLLLFSSFVLIFVLLCLKMLILLFTAHHMAHLWDRNYQ